MAMSSTIAPDILTDRRFWDVKFDSVLFYAH